MLISEPLPFVNEFLDALDTALKVHKPLTPGLSRTQRSWLGFLRDGDPDYQYGVLGAV